MNEEKLNENRELIEALAEACNDNIVILRSQTHELEKIIKNTIQVIDEAKELSNESFDKFESLGDNLVNILNVLEVNSTKPYDHYFNALEKIDNEPWEKL